MQPRIRYFSSVGVAILIGYALILPQPVKADPIVGTWRGNGIMKPSSGDREKVRCKMRFSKMSEKVFSFNATCAATSGNISQYGEVNKVKGNRYIGTFYNNKNNVSGNIRVVVNGRSQSISVSSSKGKGRMSLRKQ